MATNNVPHARLPRLSARLRLALSYAIFLVAAGFVTLAGVYVVLRYIPNYRLTLANPADAGAANAWCRENLANNPLVACPDPVAASRGDILGALLKVSGFILLALAVIGVGGGWVLAGWILRPLQCINEAALVAATGRLDHRIRLAGRNDEFRQLADTFDQMLDRLHDAFDTQERFAANASHELRTPLTINATLLDVARSYPDQQDYPQLIERLSITNARAIGLTEALLRLADANSVTATSEPVDLAVLAGNAIEQLVLEAEGREVAIETDLRDAPTVGDATLLEQLIANLVQNAIRHNHSTGQVLVTTCHDPGGRVATLRIENTGMRYTLEQVARFSEPFLRGTGRVSQAGRDKGYGLGLALVSRITAIHDGTLRLAPREAGGLIATVTLPAARVGRA